MTCTDIATHVGTIVGIVSLFITIRVAGQTKRVEAAVRDAKEATERKINYNRRRESLRDGLQEIIKRFGGTDGEIALKQLKSDCDGLLADIEYCIPREYEDVYRKTKEVRETLKRTPFTPSMVISELNSIKSALSMEGE